MACRLARKAAGRTSPNPMVGAVLVRGGKIVGRGYHKFAGGDHAEIVALKKAATKANGATLYITLEPCSHYGRTPPCAEALVHAGIKNVVVGMSDPNPLVAGCGLKILRRAGIAVRVGVHESECRELLEAFSKFITQRVPFVTLKLAATLDGKIATASGDSKWISGPESRNLVHRWRNEMDAVLVGVATVRADDPQLTCRIAGGRDPYRVVLDSRLAIRLTAQLLRQKNPSKTIIATTVKAPAAKVRALEALGVQVWRLPARAGRVAWRPLLKRLAAQGVVSLLIEGGAAIAASALKEKIIDKVEFFYAPKIIGGDGWAMIGGLAIAKMARAIELKRVAVRKSGNDLRLTGYL
ncbi:MAG: bifunctional diaminohydroxyphosphoribosylaminopyrimidine deaminase/5-amino-6-(5-phosphoribosylamino)uracil reductase RibD [Deltaproteobacteria bacterium]|nr:bifunctional diaminohydroxyphosphoribosylaminopyrimidine deaminase/5-amino-6-(5-phosphoribosylamino)uracil reductase RibD [Deltaproteobacteria bacterium]